MTALEAIAELGDALDCLANWDRLLEAFDATPSELEIDPDPIGRHLCCLDAAARTILRQLEGQMVR